MNRTNTEPGIPGQGKRPEQLEYSAMMVFFATFSVLIVLAFLLLENL